jgi:hypothetical protein
MEIGVALPQSVNLPDPVRRASTAAPVEPAASFTPPKPPPEAAPRPVPSEVIEALAARTEANTRSASRIRLDDATDRVVVQILNSDNEVIKQFPPEELLDVLKKIRQVTGLILDRQI